MSLECANGSVFETKLLSCLGAVPAPSPVKQLPIPAVQPYSIMLPSLFPQAFKLTEGESVGQLLPAVASAVHLCSDATPLQHSQRPLQMKASRRLPRSVANPLRDGGVRARRLLSVELSLPQARVRCLTSLQMTDSQLTASCAQFLPDEAILASSAPLCSEAHRSAQ